MSIELLISAFVLGLLGSGHCIGMCGGIGAALNVAIKADQRFKRLRIIFAYNLGRLSSYALIGAVAAALGSFAAPQYLRIVAAILLFFMALYLADLNRWLTLLEKAGSVLWKQIQPLGSRLMPVRTEWQAMLLGALWGWLPCGLVYSALVMALAQGTVISGALYMLLFGLGTLPAVVAGALAANSITQALQRRGLRLGMAVLMLIFAVWTLWGAMGHAGHHGHSAQQMHNSHAEHMSHSESPQEPEQDKHHHQH